MEEATRRSSKSDTASDRRQSRDSELSSPTRFQGFHRRFHSSSSNSKASLAGTPSETPLASVPSKSDATRSAKLFLQSVVRNDWEFPASGDEVEMSEVEDPREPVAYRCRLDAPSDMEGSDVENERFLASLAKQNPYKFDSPDDVAAVMMRRRRKRRRIVADELTWNTGGLHWSRQRDAWTGAVATRPGRRKDANGHADPPSRNPSTSTATDRSATMSPTSRASASTGASSSIESEHVDDAEQGPWLPVFPPLLADDNAVRKNIRPEAYPLIYSKVVLQCLTPTVPIPLTHMTNALVDGWKAEGNWPPNATPASTSTTTTPIVAMAGKRASQLLRFQRHNNGSINSSGNAVNHADKIRVRKSFGGAVKKAFNVVKNGGAAAHDDDPGIEFEDAEPAPQVVEDDNTLYSNMNNAE